MENIEGGACGAGDILAIGLAGASIALLFAFPPSAFFLVPAGTAAGISAGQAIAGCLS